jgi:hypothetical protein
MRFSTCSLSLCLPLSRFSRLSFLPPAHVRSRAFFPVTAFYTLSFFCSYALSRPGLPAAACRPAFHLHACFATISLPPHPCFCSLPAKHVSYASVLPRTFPQLHNRPTRSVRYTALLCPCPYSPFPGFLRQLLPTFHSTCSGCYLIPCGTRSSSPTLGNTPHFVTSRTFPSSSCKPYAAFTWPQPRHDMPLRWPVLPVRARPPRVLQPHVHYVSRSASFAHSASMFEAVCCHLEMQKKNCHHLPSRRSLSSFAVLVG